MSNSKQGFSLWLLPEASSAKKFTIQCQQLAQQYQGIYLPPHVTLYVGEFSVDDDYEQLLTETAAQLSPLTLAPGRLQTDPRFGCSFYLSFQQDPIIDQLARLSNWLREQSSHQTAYTFNPHMSFLYHHLTDSSKNTLNTLPAPHEPIRFEGICWASHPHIIEDVADIEAFQIHTTLPLTQK